MRSDIILNSTGSKNQVDNICHQQAENDIQLIDLWINGRSKHTQRAYLKDVNSFLKTVAKPLYQILLVDLQGYATDLMNSEFKNGNSSSCVIGNQIAFCVCSPYRLSAI